MPNRRPSSTASTSVEAVVEAAGGHGPVVDHMARAARTDPGPIVVGLAGPVAAGKSTTAEVLAAGLRAQPHHHRTAVLSTDAFLYPNAVLEDRGLLDQKGFPASYDLRSLGRVVDRLRRGAATLTVPVYSHEHYDIDEDRSEIEAPEVLILEGLNVVQAAPEGERGPGPASLLDVAVYLHVDEALARDWFGERFVALTRAAADGSFYSAWSDLDDASVRAVAAQVWDAVNGVNLAEHILPSRANAHLIITKGRDHAVTRLEWRSPQIGPTPR